MLKGEESTLLFCSAVGSGVQLVTEPLCDRQHASQHVQYGT